MEITREQKALAAQVTLPMTPLPSTPGRCPAWIEAAGAECKLPAVEGLLCGRHHREAQKKLAALRKTTPHPWKQDPMTDHPLTETTEFTDEVVLALLNAWTGRELPTLDRYDHLIQVAARRALTAVLNHPDAAELFADEDALRAAREEGWDQATRWIDSYQGGPNGRTTSARSENPYRPAPTRELPTKFRTVIVPADGREYIEAEVDGTVWRTREAILGLDGRWHGVWRAGRVAVGSTSSDSITLDTWKEDDR